MFISTPQAQKEISFKAVNYTLSRSALNNTGAFDTNDNMYVSAILTPSTAGAVGSKLFEDVTFTYQGKTDASKKYWAATPAIYYPYEGSLEFMAYSVDKTKLAATNPVSWVYDNGQFKTLTLDFGDKLNTGLEDVMFSNILQQNLTSPSEMSFAFSHAMALLTFEVQTTSDVAGSSTEITVKKIEVNAQRSGVLTVTADYSGTKPATSAEWSTVTPAYYPVLYIDPTKNNAISAAESTTKLTASAVPFGTGLLVTGGQTPSSFKVTYDMKVGNQTFTGLTKTVTFDQTKIDKWNMGNKYAYTITVSPNEITFKASIGAYSTGKTSTSNSQSQSI